MPFLVRMRAGVTPACRQAENTKMVNGGLKMVEDVFIKNFPGHLPSTIFDE